MTESAVTFSAKDYKKLGQWKEFTISGEEFIRRFLMHVPPKRFVRIRHYGLLSSRNKNKKITMCRNILGCQKYISRLKNMDAPAIIQLLYNQDICKCSSCGGKILPLSLDNAMSHRSHICFADVYELNTYFEASDGGLFVMQKIISSNKEIYISHHSVLNFE